MALSPRQNDSVPRPARARVLIVDDPVVARGLFSRWISEHPALAVIGVATDGASAIIAAKRHRPDIIVLDLEMPVLVGLAALQQLRRVSPASRIMVASCQTSRKAPLALECLALGALDALAKPDGNRDLTMSACFRDMFLSTLEGLISAKSPPPGRQRPGLALLDANGRMPADEPTRPATDEPAEARPDVAPRALLIGASTGGPKAITRVLDDLGPAIALLPVIIIQHMPALITASFAEQLAARFRHPVAEARHREEPLGGHIYIAPGGRHLRLERFDGKTRFWLDHGPPVNFCRPAIDLTFCDAASLYGASALGVVLTGMGSDGTIGARHLRDAGARIIVQDKATSAVWGMPGSIVRQGLAEQTLGIEQIGPALSRIILGGSPP
ncbi:MAG: chemotaxis-specific protein-glutamate methyltransferase CheB [Hyphomicrobiales bacterium]|nr:chemotaxis-specific protein-glutamate methyltransferase CheB [Hyphomicrobiales bacterium]